MKSKTSNQKSSWQSLDNVAFKLHVDRGDLIKMIHERRIPPVLDKTANFVIKSTWIPRIKAHLSKNHTIIA